MVGSQAMSELRAIPRFGGPISNFRAMRRDPEALLLRPLLRAAPLVELPMLGARIFALNERALVEEVVVRQHASLEKDRYSHRLREFLGEGLLTSEGGLWRRQRRLIQPAFHRRRIAEYAAVMARLSAATFAGWGGATAEQTRDVHSEMSALTLRIAGETLFGADMGGATEAVGEAIALVMGRYAGEHFGGLLPLWAPTRHNRRIVRAIRRVDAALGALIAARRGARGQGADLLTMLLEAQDEDGSRMSDQQIRDECITLFLAGHETTALSTSYALYLLAQHPEAQARVQAAIDAALGGRPPTIEDLPRLSAVEEVLKEAMRLYPPAWSIGREALAPVRAGAVTLPRGAQLAIFPWLMHRDPRSFPDPERFAPERWQGGAERALPKLAYMPFGAGPRVCIGNAFAMVEGVVILCCLLQRFTVAPVDAAPLRLQFSITLRPIGGIRLRLRPRAGALA